MGLRANTWTTSATSALSDCPHVVAPEQQQVGVEDRPQRRARQAETLPAPRCFKCNKGVVETCLAQDTAVVWVCPKCRIEGRISNWQGSLSDLRNRPPTSG